MATPFDRTSLQHVAQLAALTLTEQEADALAKDMQRILAYVDELEAVDTSGVEPTTVLSLGTTIDRSGLRPDERQPSLDRGEVLAQAPRATENGFLVPTFVDAES